jgi:hypothetical protein
MTWGPDRGWKRPCPPFRPTARIRQVRGRWPMRAASDLRELTGGPSKISAVANLREGADVPNSDERSKT